MNPELPKAGLTVTYLEAAIEILTSTRQDMTVREITNEAIQRGLLKPAGKTPHATMTKVLYCYVRDAAEPRIERRAEQGLVRARRGSVRWRGIAERASYPRPRDN
jgi:HB1, ASXL, restriction endonuclease HTH domain